MKSELYDIIIAEKKTKRIVAIHMHAKSKLRARLICSRVKKAFDPKEGEYIVRVVESGSEDIGDIISK